MILNLYCFGMFDFVIRMMIGGRFMAWKCLPPNMQVSKNKYYFSPSCPFSHRTSIVLLEIFNEAQLRNFEFVEINLLRKPDWFKELNPIGKLPVLEYEGKLLVESLSICEYLLNINPNHTLIPVEPFEVYKVRAFIERFMSSTCIYFYRVLRSNDQDQVRNESLLLLKSLLAVS